MTDPSPPDVPAVHADALPPLSVLTAAAREAGEIALRYFGKARSWTKAGNSPVTEADLAIDHMLHGELRAAYPGFGWLSEEIEDDGSRLSGAPTFIVDPIDGTRGFMAGGDDWAVSIALVAGGRPALGVLFNPVRGDLLFAEASQGAFLEDDDGSVHALAPSGHTSLVGARLAFPGAVTADSAFTKMPRIASLALRFAGVAQGELDGCVASPNAKHWDIAAADLIVREAGLALEHLSGKAPRYDGHSIAHPALVSGTPSLCSELRALIKRRYP